MKNILKYTLSAVAALTTLASCQEFEEFGKTVDATSDLIYANTGTNNVYTAKVMHTPNGSTGDFTTKFGINCNSTRHAAAKVAFAYDASLVESYNAAHGTTYAVLPEEYLSLENSVLTLPADARISADSVEVTLTGDLAALTQRRYLAPLRLKPQGIDASELMGVVYVAVDTEVNIIRPIESTDDMVGFPATGRTSWTADCADFKNLFDGDTNTESAFQNMTGNVVTVDMKQTLKMTGLALGYYYYEPNLSIEYSVDGEEWLQAGTPTSEQYVSSDSQLYTAFYGNVEARYLRLSIDFSSSWAKTITELNVYTVDSDDPTIYTVVGADNTISGKVIHKPILSKAQLSGSFSARTTVASTSGYTVSVAADPSLVAAYNAAHGTSYVALPAANLQLSQASLSIAAGEYKSDAETEVSLTGDLTALNDLNGYLAVLKLSATGAASSASRGAVYVVVNVENNVIRPVSSADDMVGFPASGRTSWTADCTDYANLFDGSTSTRVNFTASTNVVTIDMKQQRMITGLHLYTYEIGSLSVEYSVDGVNFLSAGTPESDDVVWTGTYSAGDYYVGFYNHLGGRYLRLTLNYTGYYKRLCEVDAYEIESTEPTVYTICGTDNVLAGSIAHTPVGSFNGVSAAFNASTTVAAAGGFSVNAEFDASLVATYNSAHNTSYVAMPAANVLISGAPCAIAANENKSAEQIKVSLTGDLTGLTNAKGYLIPVKLSATGAVTSTGRGVVYIVVTPNNDVMRKNFAVSDIEGSLVADRSGWSIVKCDESGIYSGAYTDLFDGNTTTYIRTWGGPVSFTLDLGKECDVTGLVITARTDISSYANYQPNSILIEYSADNEDYTTLGEPTYAEGGLVRAVPSSYAALYGSQTMRYIRITATYGSNMGVGEFNLYTK